MTSCSNPVVTIYSGHLELPTVHPSDTTICAQPDPLRATREAAATAAWPLFLCYKPRKLELEISRMREAHEKWLAHLPLSMSRRDTQTSLDCPYLDYRRANFKSLVIRGSSQSHTSRVMEDLLVAILSIRKFSIVSLGLSPAT